MLLRFLVVPASVPAGETGPEKDSARYCESGERIDLRGNPRAHEAQSCSFVWAREGSEYLGRDLLGE